MSGVKIIWDSYQLERWLDRVPRIRVPDEIRKEMNARGREAVGTIRGNMDYPTSKTGNLRKSVRYRIFVQQAGTVGMLAGPMGRPGNHRHLVEFGHRMVGHTGIDTGRRVRPNPRVTQVRPRVEGILTSAIDQALERAVQVEGL
jgi:hypothetical protein